MRASRFAFLLIAILTIPATAAEETSPRWLSDYEEARKIARRTGKPIFVVFRCEH